MKNEELISLYDASDSISKVDLELCRRFHRMAKDILFLDYLCPECPTCELPQRTEELSSMLSRLFALHDQEDRSQEFLDSLPEIRKSAYRSAVAIYNGDPSSKSLQEVILCFPGFEAILSYRIAHKILQLGLPFEARLISEEAHGRTGIDIHPSATIGEDFFIDHGTGIVIGETTIIGNNVKIYQGVTLGALSLSKGKALAGQKRHPTIEDNVTIYSSAAIFGGKTVIGHDSTIGAVVRLMESVPPYSVVYMGEKGVELSTKEAEK